MDDDPRASILEARTTDVLQGHDLGPFMEVKTTAGGSVSHCRKCDKSVWVGR